jgi:hypothetical protein
MADILVDQQGAPTAPASNTSLIYVDNVSQLLTTRTSVKPLTVGGVRNSSTSTQAYTTAEIYLAGSSLAIPSHLIVVGATFRWRVVLTKTAGTGVLVWKIYVGTLGTTGDAVICTFTQVSVPTSATDTAFVDVEWIIRTIGAAATSTAGLRLNHVLAVTGFSQLGTNVQMVAGTTFNSTTAALIAGLSFSHGTAGAGNIETVSAEMVNG